MTPHTYWDSYGWHAETFEEAQRRETRQCELRIFALEQQLKHEQERLKDLRSWGA
jgi:hypothetical protein